MSSHDAFIRLKDLVVNEKSRLLEYKKLFGADDVKMRKHILDSSAPGFFRILFDLFWSDMVLSISKLTDPPTTKVKGGTLENLTVTRLVKSWESTDRATFNKMNAELRDLEKVVETVRAYRSKVVAHQDYEQAMTGTMVVKLERIEIAFSIVERILNTHSTKIGLGYFSFDSAPVGGAGSLVHVIEESLIYRKLKASRRSPGDDMRERVDWIASVRV